MDQKRQSRKPGSPTSAHAERAEGVPGQPGTPIGGASGASRPAVGAEDLLRSYGISERNLDEVRAFGKTASAKLDDFVDAFYKWLGARPEFETFFSDPGMVDRVKGQQKAYWNEFLQANVDDSYVTKRRLVGETHARINLPLDAYFAAMNFSLGWFSDLLRSGRSAAEKTASMLDSLARLVHLDTGIVVASYYHRMNEIITKQHQSLLELSTPVIRVWDQIVLLPIIGVVDTVRASQMIERLLQAIVETEARVAILDVTGVPTVDTLVARHLIKTVSAAKMLGAEVLVTGMSPETAQTLTTLGVDLGMVKSRGSLRAGVAEAFALLGKRVTSPGEPGSR